MHAQRAVDPGAVDAQEHAVRDARPARIFGSTIKAYLLEGWNVPIREEPREETLGCSSKLSVFLQSCCATAASAGDIIHLEAFAQGPSTSVYLRTRPHLLLK